VYAHRMRARGGRGESAGVWWRGLGVVGVESKLAERGGVMKENTFEEKP